MSRRVVTKPTTPTTTPTVQPTVKPTVILTPTTSTTTTTTVTPTTSSASGAEKVKDMVTHIVSDTAASQTKLIQIMIEQVILAQKEQLKSATAEITSCVKLIERRVESLESQVAEMGENLDLSVEITEIRELIQTSRLIPLTVRVTDPGPSENMFEADTEYNAD